LTWVEQWFEYESASSRGEPGNASVVAVREYGADDSQDVEMGIHRTYWPGIDFTKEVGGTVWFATLGSGDYDRLPVLYVLAVLPDGRVFFPGHCQHDILYLPLERIIQGDFHEALAGLPGATQTDIRSLVGLAAPTEEPEPREPILNPETASQDLLDSLQFVALQVVVVQPLDDGAGVCPKSSAGWNDCFFASEAYTDAPLVLDAYVGEDGVLEFWQLDESEDLRSPVDLAGTIEIPEAMRGSEDLAASVVFDAHGSPMVRDSAWIRLADLTNEFLDSDDGTWSGFRPVELPSDSE
jgi:hypothetical protein